MDKVTVTEADIALWMVIKDAVQAEVEALRAVNERLLDLLRALDEHARPWNWDDEDQPGEAGYDCANAWRALDEAIARKALDTEGAANG